MTGNRPRLTRETLVTLGVVVLETDLELDRLQEVALLGLIAVLEEFYSALVLMSETTTAVSRSECKELDRNCSHRHCGIATRSEWWWREGQDELTLDVRTNACDRDFRHFECVSQKMLVRSFGSSAAVVVWGGKRKCGTAKLCGQDRASLTAPLPLNLLAFDSPKTRLGRQGRRAVSDKQLQSHHAAAFLSKSITFTGWLD
jgi:hypothetical protein